MLEFIFGALYVGTSATIVKQFRPNAFRGSNCEALITDIALTAAGAVTVAPVVVAVKALSCLAETAYGCTIASRRHP